MASLSQIPDWQILRGVSPGGIRLPKLKKFVEPYVTGGWKSHLFQPYRPASVNTVTNRMGDLISNGDLRYWAGTDQSHPYSACRACGEVAMYKEERKEHLKRGCGTQLTNAYKLLLRRPMRCVVCDEETSQSSWGVPLCDKECRHDWCWCDRQPDALSAALVLVEKTK